MLENCIIQMKHIDMSYPSNVYNASSSSRSCLPGCGERSARRF